MPKEPIAQFRKDAGLTIDQAADLFKVDRTTIIRWEKGSPRIPVNRLDDAAKLLKVQKSEIRPDIFAGA